MKRISCLFCLSLLLCTLAGCATPSWMPTMLRPYRPDVQQGNIVTKDMVDQLRPGMTRDQVRFLLGTPMLADIFHQDRWDYPYALLRGKSGERQVRKLYVVFADGKLQRYASDPMPTEPLADSLILGRKSKPAAVPAPAPAAPVPAPPGSSPGGASGDKPAAP